MAVLYSYAQSADQSGYYLKGWTPETGHTTIQVRRVCGKLFEWLGFSVGDQLPHDLLHGLLDVGLLYTGDPAKPSEDIPDDFDFGTDMKNVLSKKQYNRLIGFVQSYGENAPTRVEKLLDRLDAQSVVVDEKYIPDPSERGGYGNSESRDVDHGRFENIIRQVYREEELPEPLADLDLPDEVEHESILDAAAEYHYNHHAVTDARVTDLELEYATRMPSLSSSNRSAGPRCGFRFGLGDGETVVLETIVNPDTLNAALDRGDPGIRHRVVIATDQAVDWETVVPQDSDLSPTLNRSELLSHQVSVLRMMEKSLQQHPGISASDLIEKVVDGGYLERGIRTAPTTWENSLLGELLEPDVPDDRYTGTVDFFNDKGGYGFIETPDLEDDVFYHMEDIGGPDITEGQQLEFNVVEAEEGPRATDVKRRKKPRS